MNQAVMLRGSEYQKSNLYGATNGRFRIGQTIRRR